MQPILSSFPCPTGECDFESEDQAELKSHLKDIHSFNIKEEYSCKKCEYSINNKKEFEKHKQIHSNERYSCQYCDFITGSKAVLMNHIRNHLEKRCTICGYEPSRKAYLKGHVEAVHKGLFLIQCQLCDYWGKNIKLIRKHYRHAHNAFSHRKERQLASCENQKKFVEKCSEKIKSNKDKKKVRTYKKPEKDPSEIYKEFSEENDKIEKTYKEFEETLDTKLPKKVDSFNPEAACEAQKVVAQLNQETFELKNSMLELKKEPRIYKKLKPSELPETLDIFNHRDADEVQRAIAKINQETFENLKKEKENKSGAKKILTVSENENTSLKEVKKLVRHLYGHKEFNIKGEIVWSFVCHTCGYSTTSRHHMDEHADAHVEGLKLNCNTCGKSFKRLNTWRKHGCEKLKREN